MLESFCVKEAIFEKIEGMFAVLIYDQKEKKTIIARDRIGIKPLYYNATFNNLIVSSEIKPILKFIRNYSFNNEAFVDFFFKGSMDHDKTFFKNVEILEPGSFITYKNKSIKKNKFWHYPTIITKKYKPTDINKILNLSIEKHLISDVKIGSFLSGGTDSSLITNLSNKKLNYKMSTFTYDFLNSDITSVERANHISRK